MLDQKVLEYLEQNIEVVNHITYFMKYPDELTYNALMLEIEVDCFDGYEWLLPIMLLSSEDPVIKRASKRLLLLLYHEKLQATDRQKLVECVANILTDEKAKWEIRTERLHKLDKEHKI